MFGSLLLVGGLLLAQADAKPAADDLASQVRRLVRQLDAPQLKQRDAAEEELLRLGSQILPLLPKEPDPNKAEAAQRIARVRQKLQRAEAETVMQPSLVTLHGALPLSKILAAIEQQSGNKITDVRRGVVANVPDPEIKVDFEKTPFWQALDQVLDQAGLSVYPYAQEKVVQVVLQPGEEGTRAKRACYRGPFRFEPISLLATSDLRKPGGSSLKLEVEVSWEPRVEPITLHLPLGTVKAAGDTGRPVTVESSDADLELPVDPGPIAQKFVIPLVLPPRDVKHVAKLQGTLNVLLPGKIETFRFADLEKAKNVEKRIGSATVVLDEVMKNNKLWEIFITLRFDNARDSLASHRTWAFQNPAILEGPGGKTISFSATDPVKRTESEIGSGYLFNVENLKGYTFVYKTPTAIFSMPLAFEFGDLPLP